ncbi:MAG: hypothetical protein ACXU7H_07805 [Burkholderiaceae bacterium]
MVWTDAVQGATRSPGWSLGKRCNMAMRRPGHLPGGFAPESTLDSVVLLANMRGYSTRRTLAGRIPACKPVLLRRWSAC